MKTIKNVHGSQAIKPATIESNGTTVYIRSGIHRETMTFPDMPEREPMEEWVYDEDQMNNCEYDLLLNLKEDIPDDRWDEGLQEACREARYRRWDGPEQSVRRKIELGIDVEANNIKLKAILEYKQAVNETKNQSGYPNNVPVWPKEPEL